ncbi:MAG: ABC transporter permease [Bacteroidales bacterium]|nr:ABC transporter permease [Bacteroidales bacterium]
MDFWREIFMALGRNKLRTFLTGFAISWGIFILIVLLAAGNGIMNGISAEFSDQSKNTYMIYGGETSIPFKGHGTNRSIWFNDKDIRFLETEVKEVDEVSPRIYQSGFANVGDKSGSIFIQGVRPVFKDINNTKMLEGRFVSELDEKNSEKFIVIDDNLRKKLFGEGVSPLGQFVIVSGIAYKVIGVSEGEGRSDGGNGYVPFSTLKKITRQSDYWMLHFTVKGLETKEENEAFTEYLRTQLGRLHEFHPNDQSAIYMHSTQEQYLQTMKILRTLELFIWIIGFAMLISGIVGVSNIMRITVKERTNEIGIRKALGAKSRSILTSIVTESLIITAIFGYIGMWLGMVVAEVAGSILGNAQLGGDMSLHIVPSIDIRIVLMATALLIVCGVLAGFFPARNAVKIKPIEAMNYR